MTARAAIIARILDRVQFLTGAAPDALALDKPLVGQRVGTAIIDSLDVTEIVMAVEDEFTLRAGAIDERPDWSVDGIADAVIAARGIAT